jgi:hypothetical protein
LHRLAVAPFAVTRHTAAEGNEDLETAVGWKLHAFHVRHIGNR